MSKCRDVHRSMNIELMQLNGIVLITTLIHWVVRQWPAPSLQINYTRNGSSTFIRVYDVIDVNIVSPKDAISAQLDWSMAFFFVAYCLTVRDVSHLQIQYLMLINKSKFDHNGCVIDNNFRLNKRPPSSPLASSMGSAIFHQVERRLHHTKIMIWQNM